MGGAAYGKRPTCSGILQVKPARILPEIAEILDLPSVLPVLRVLNGDGEETRLVGGVVRNFLMQRPIADIDMTTTALPDVVAKRAVAAGWKVVPTGIEHGTVTIVVDHVPFEVTTLREDIETDGRHAVVKFGRDFAADARRRDFTVNALSVDLDGRLHDYCDGAKDIAASRIRFIGNASQRIREDYLRILRFFRFHAAYGNGAPERADYLACISGAHGLAQISAERIRVEVMKLFAGENADQALSAMAEGGILTRILGGAIELGRWRKLPRSASAIDQCAALTVMVREDAGRLHERLRLANHERDFLQDYGVLLEKAKGASYSFAPDDIRRLAADWPVTVILAVVRATTGEPAPKIEADALKLLERFASGTEPVPVFPVRGADFVARGVAKGPEVGRLMEQARALWLRDGCPVGEGVAENLLARVMPDNSAQ